MLMPHQFCHVVSVPVSILWLVHSKCVIFLNFALRVTCATNVFKLVQVHALAAKLGVQLPLDTNVGGTGSFRDSSSVAEAAALASTLSQVQCEMERLQTAESAAQKLASDLQVCPFFFLLYDHNCRDVTVLTNIAGDLYPSCCGKGSINCQLCSSRSCCGAHQGARAFCCRYRASRAT